MNLNTPSTVLVNFKLTPGAIEDRYRYNQLKDYTFSEEILDAVIAVSQGGSPMTPAIARKVLRYFHGPNNQATIQTTNTTKSTEVHDQLFASLSPRELEILEGLVDGLSYKMIAARYFISADTVKNHIQGIYRKLHVNSKGEAISYVLKKGITGSRNDPSL
jgi:DNA-binding NarL/FixJ family response regulator